MIEILPIATQSIEREALAQLYGGDELYCASKLAQERTLVNASKVALIKRITAKPQYKELTDLTKRVANVEKQIIKAKGKERENLITDRDKMRTQIEQMQKDLEKIGDEKQEVRDLRAENNKINANNHEAIRSLSSRVPIYSTGLSGFISETDKTTKDMKSVSTFVAPSGFAGFAPSALTNFFSGASSGPPMAA